jgi:hypothetical protein
MESLPLHIIVAFFIQPTPKVLKINPKLRLKNDVGTEFSGPECRKNQKSGNITSNTIIYSLYGVLAGTIKN